MRPLQPAVSGLIADAMNISLSERWLQFKIPTGKREIWGLNSKSIVLRIMAD